jgi:undecaprenyl phosphate-alpha-L-ara4N flippase subunit ArnF
MKWGMSHLPLLSSNIFSSAHNFFQFLSDASIELLFVGVGICAYILSMFFWLLALGQMPLSKAYPLLSISYVLVYVATVVLPWFNQAFSLAQCGGVILITIGVLLILSSPSRIKSV